MVATVRHFNGTTDELTTLAGSGAIDDISTGGWVKRDAIGTRAGMIGRVTNSTHEWSFYQYETGILVFDARDGSGTSSFTDDVVDTVSDWVFVFVTRKKSTGVVKFYVGTNAMNIAQVASTGGSTDQIPNGGGLGTSLGRINQGNLISAVGWDGYMDQWGLWTVELTLDEIKAASVCGAEVRSGDAVFIVPITGDDPEPSSGAGTPDMTVTGTTILTEANIGCERAAGGVIIPPGNPALVSPNLPHLSGGPGGGLGIPTLSWDDNGPASVSPTTGNARMVQAPDWGSMGIKGSRGGRKGGLLAQRQSGMYRGLDHLATKLRGRRK